MSGLYSFLKGSTVIDLIAIAFVFISSFVLIVTGIALFIRAKRKKWFYVLVVTAFLPLLIALAGVAVRAYTAEMLLAMAGEIDQSLMEEFRSELRTDYLTMTLLGAVGTAFPLMIGGSGLVFKKNSETATL